MEPVKVEAWQTLEGTIFLDYDRAFRYNQLNVKSFNAEKLFKDNEETITNYLLERLKDPNYWVYRTPKEGQEINLSFDSDGWDCDNKENPTGKCIYEWSICEENCIYCGGPEERK